MIDPIRLSEYNEVDSVAFKIHGETVMHSTDFPEGDLGSPERIVVRFSSYDDDVYTLHLSGARVDVHYHDGTIFIHPDCDILSLGFYGHGGESS